MFDDARPERLLQKIWVAAFDQTRFNCARCQEEILVRDIALFTRTRPGDPFDPWCAECAHTLVRWAGIGALQEHAFDDEAAREKMERLTADGHW